MQVFTGVLRREGVDFQTIIMVHVCVRYFEHEHMFVTYLLLQVV